MKCFGQWIHGFDRADEGAKSSRNNQPDAHAAPCRRRFPADVDLVAAASFLQSPAIAPAGSMASAGKIQLSIGEVTSTVTSDPPGVCNTIVWPPTSSDLTTPKRLSRSQSSN